MKLYQVTCATSTWCTYKVGNILTWLSCVSEMKQTRNCQGSQFGRAYRGVNSMRTDIQWVTLIPASKSLTFISRDVSLTKAHKALLYLIILTLRVHVSRQAFRSVCPPSHLQLLCASSTVSAIQVFSYKTTNEKSNVHGPFHQFSLLCLQPFAILTREVTFWLFRAPVL